MKKNLNDKTITINQVGKKIGKFVLFIRCGNSMPLCLNYYESDPDIIIVLSRYEVNNFSLDNEFWVISGGLSKFDAARLFFLRYPEFRDYDGYAFFDPDVEIPFNKVAFLFNYGLNEKKAIFQAAVAPSSHTFWNFLYQGRSRGWREVSFVEVMAPFFSKKALGFVIDGFSASVSTWGLEYEWYSKCRGMSMAVYDPVIMRHDNKVDLGNGPFYKYLAQMGVDPFEELRLLKARYVGKFYIECEIPAWVPRAAKVWYVQLLGAKTKFKERVAVTRFARFIN